MILYSKLHLQKVSVLSKNFLVFVLSPPMLVVADCIWERMPQHSAASFILALHLFLKGV